MSKRLLGMDSRIYAYKQRWRNFSSTGAGRRLFLSKQIVPKKSTRKVPEKGNLYTPVKSRIRIISPIKPTIKRLEAEERTNRFVQARFVLF